MSKYRTPTLCAAVLSLVGSCGGEGGGQAARSSGSSATTAPASGLWATAYYPAYATGRMPISAIPFSSLTHVVHFALVPNRDGTLADPDGLRAQTTALVGAARA